MNNKSMAVTFNILDTVFSISAIVAACFQFFQLAAFLWILSEVYAMRAHLYSQSQGE
jgi:hypothetical protein